MFIDYWNFQLTLNERVAAQTGAADCKFPIDWRKLGSVLAAKSCGVLSCDQSAMSYEGCYVYTSFNPTTEDGKKFKKWATGWLDRQPGVNVEIRERKPKSLPACPLCKKKISHCPHQDCGKPIVATVEKGVDTLIVTDLLRLGLSNSYDVAVLATSDADMVPAVSYIQTTGKKVVQAGFPPKGIDLATECWGSFDVMHCLSEIRRNNSN